MKAKAAISKWPKLVRISEEMRQWSARGNRTALTETYGQPGLPRKLVQPTVSRTNYLAQVVKRQCVPKGNHFGMAPLLQRGAPRATAY